MKNPVARMFYGVHCYMRGVSWLLHHKRWLLLSFAPGLLSIILTMFTWGWLFSDVDAVVAPFIFDRPEGWWWLPFYWLTYALTLLGVLGASLLAILLTVNILAAPLYEQISVAVERDITGKVEEVSLWRGLTLMAEELKKVLFILALSLVSFVVTSWVPGLSLLALAVTAFLVGWDFYDYPLARRGWTFRQRLQQVKGDGWAVLAFGTWFLIPFVQFLLLPLAVAGGTIMGLEGVQTQADKANGS